MAGESAPFASDDDDDEQAELAWTEAEDQADDGVVGVVIEDPAVSWGSRLFDLIFGPPGLDRRRLAALDPLDQAIARRPNAATNYVLRGELYWRAGEYELAASDFESAFRLASAQFEADDWGLLSQALRDRAEQGLARAQRKMNRKRK